MNVTSMQIGADAKDAAAEAREAATARQPSNIAVKAVSRHASVNMFDAQPNAGILQTAQNNGTPAVSSRLSPTSTVEVGGMRMELRVAERLGYVTRNRDGGYHEPAQAAPAAVPQAQPKQEPQAPQAPQHAEQPPTSHALPAEAEALRSEIMHGVPGEIVGDAYNNVLDSVVKGEADIDLTELQTAMGFNDTQAIEAFSGLRDSFQKQANDAALAAGVSDVNALWAWARANRPNDVRAALGAQLEGRGIEGYSKLAKAFARVTRG